MNSAYKIQLFALVNTIISIFGIWYTQSFYWLMIGLISFAFVMIFSVNIAMHRFISHRSFTTGKIKTKLLKYLTVISAFGSPLSWAPMHRYHHVYSGTDKDNQAPENIGYVRAWLTLYDPIKIPTSLIKDIVRDKDCMFIANNYWKLLFSYVIILYLINPLIGIFVFSFPAACCYQAAGAFGVIPHSKKFGYLVIEPNKGDTSVNSPLASLLSWGEGWHNYHHTIVKDYRHGHKWWEIDPPAWFIEKLFINIKQKGPVGP